LDYGQKRIGAVVAGRNFVRRGGELSEFGFAGDGNSDVWGVDNSARMIAFLNEDRAAAQYCVLSLLFATKPPKFGED
jgi:hypothetical protein